jgi:hypothetical protein
MRHGLVMMLPIEDTSRVSKLHSISGDMYSTSKNSGHVVRREMNLA